MPTYRNITINLQSDTTQNILEFAPPPTPTTSPRKIASSPPNTPEDDENTSDHPQLHDERHAAISVYIPFVPKTLFWVNYQVAPPAAQGIFYVFKLFVNKIEAATWSCSRKQQFRGKCMFGLFDTGCEEDGPTGASLGKGMQKRVFRFGEAEYRACGDLSSDEPVDRFVEIRVFRANKKSRREPILQGRIPAELPGQVQYAHLEGNDEHTRMTMLTADRLANGGLLHSKAPQRYFKFGLLDPLDEPFATFRFFYRTWAEIELLGLRLGTVEGDETSIFTADTAILDEDASGSAQEGNFGTSVLRHQSNRSSISQEYFARYPTPEVPPKDEPVCSPSAMATHRQVIGPTPFSSQSSAFEGMGANAQQSIGYPSVFQERNSQSYNIPAQQSPYVDNPYNSWNHHYQGNAFAQQQMAAQYANMYPAICGVNPSTGMPIGGYHFLPPSHPHAVQPVQLEKELPPTPTSPASPATRRLKAALSFQTKAQLPKHQLVTPANRLHNPPRHNSPALVLQNDLSTVTRHGRRKWQAKECTSREWEGWICGQDQPCL